MKYEVCLASACLLGINCRYDGKSKKTTPPQLYINNRIIVPVCPEQLGGLPTPRAKSTLTNGDGNDVLNKTAKVINENGIDVTSSFVKGAMETLKLTELYDVKKVFMKSKSPSCGCGSTYIDNILTKGDGVTTALLKKHNIKIEIID